MQALVNLDALTGLFPHRVARRSQLAALGLHGAATSAGTPLLPGVVALGPAPPHGGRDQLVQAALLYAGARAVVTGLDALRLHRALRAANGPVHVLTPSRDRTRGCQGVIATGTATMPPPVLRAGFPCTSLPRAAVDAGRLLGTVERTLSLLGGLVGAGHTTVAELRAEVGAARSAGTALVRRALGELGAGARSPAESWARDLVRDAGLPTPAWNASVRHDGRFLAVVDAWWPDAGLVWEFGEPPRHAAELRAAGLRLVCTPPGRLRREPAAVAAELRHAYKLAARRTADPGAATCAPTR